MKSKKSVLRECFLGVIDFNEAAALEAMKIYAELYHENKVKKDGKIAVCDAAILPQCRDMMNSGFCGRCGGKTNPTNVTGK